MQAFDKYVLQMNGWVHEYLQGIELGMKAAHTINR